MKSFSDSKKFKITTRGGGRKKESDVVVVVFLRSTDSVFVCYAFGPNAQRRKKRAQEAVKIANETFSDQYQYYYQTEAALMLSHAMFRVSTPLRVRVNEPSVHAYTVGETDSDTQTHT